MAQTTGSAPESPPLQSKPAGSFVLVPRPSPLSMARGQARERGEVGRALDSLSGSGPGAAGAPSSPAQHRSPRSRLCGAVALSGGASSFGDLVGQRLQGWGSFRETQPPGPALSCRPQVSGTLKNLLLWVDLSVLDLNGGPGVLP